MPNYTINTVTTLEEPGDVVSGGTLPASNALVITPDAGYVLDAAGFSATTPYPTGVTNVTFANSTTAFAVGNVVNVTVTYASNLTMPTADLNISINICENGGVNTGPTGPSGPSSSSTPTVVRLGIQKLNSTFVGGSHTITFPQHPNAGPGDPFCTSALVTNGQWDDRYCTGSAFSICHLPGNIDFINVISANSFTIPEDSSCPQAGPGGFLYGGPPPADADGPRTYFDNHKYVIDITADPSAQVPYTVVQGVVNLCSAANDPDVRLLTAWDFYNSSISSCGGGTACGGSGGMDPSGLFCSDMFKYKRPGLINKFHWYITNIYYNANGGINKFEYNVDYTPYTQAELDASTRAIPSPRPSIPSSNRSHFLPQNINPGTVSASANPNNPYEIDYIFQHISRVTTDSSYGNFLFVKNLVDSAAPTTGSNGGWDVLLNQAGETRTITVDADPGAVFSATFVNASNASILASPISNVTVGPSGSYSWSQTFPSVSATTTYTLVISAGNNTQLSSMFLSRTPSSTFVYNQVFTTPGSGPLIRVTSNSASGFGFNSITPVTLSSTFVPNYRFGPTNNTVPFTMAITKSGGGNLSLTRQPIWDSDYTNSDPASNGGTVVDLSNITATGSGTSTITLSGNATRTLIGTAAVDMALQLDNFINVAGSNIAVSGITLQYDTIASGQFNVGSSIQILANVTPSNPTNPLLTWTVSGSGFTVTPSADTHKATVSSATTAGTRTVTCTAQDGSGVSATIDVTALAQNLITVDDEVTAYKGVATTLPIVSNDTTRGGGCTIVIVSAPTHAVTSIQGETITYTTEAGVNADADEFTYKLTKSGFADSNTSTVSIQLLNAQN